MEDKTIKQHLKELKQEGIKLIIPLTAIFGIFFFTAKYMIVGLLNYYNIPLNSVVSLTPFESIQTSLSIAGTMSIMFCLPLFFKGAFRYSKELMSDEVYKKSNKLVWKSYALAIGGFVFGMLVFSKLVLLNMFSTYSITNVSWSILAVFGFIINSAVAFGIAMQLVLIIPATVKWDLVKKQDYKNFRPLAILVIAIISATITPPDVLSMLVMGIPIVGAYEAGILFSKSKSKQEVTK